VPTDRLLDRRTFLADLGHGAFALAIVGIAGCGPSVVGSLAPTGVAGPLPTRSPASGGPATPSPTGGAASAPLGSLPPGKTWEPVNLGFVSAYLLIRKGEAALVDTGVAGSEGAIESSLASIGLGWAALGHVIITHSHGDHAGSRIAVLERAPDATAYAGAQDIPAMGGVELTAVGDGDRVFDLQIVTTPGHTAGSVSVLDSVNGVLVAGDALGTADGKPVLPSSRFTADMDEAGRSIVKLGGLTFETLLVGHGDPIATGAAALVAELGATA
jgi:glyoxylase-like metal-dependent hydrolase (beta-lactamase superfamily II)